MMRLTMALWWSLAVIWLLASQAGVGAVRGQVARNDVVAGQGANLDDARRAALEKAVATIAARADELRLRHWQPTAAYLQKHWIDGPGRPGPDEPLANDLTAKTWQFSLKLPDDEALRQLDLDSQRRQVSEQRMGLLLRVVVGLMLMFAAWIGCIRLDERTKGRYSNWLRLAAIVASAAAATGCWWFS